MFFISLVVVDASESATVACACDIAVVLPGEYSSRDRL